ncbi:3-deoxy-D-manno-octulosonic acid transferase [Hyphomonas johnsonii]|uniref:3-deoxy-D-manno-octulosonic acid transferase n=1 Tax=Hyphomonas johnsonii MHS-2 TaxID=1280950 RepID=A0A059FU23_9PROT|nr:glycosyltransferase N-terminal domain-containing protein [Hyphomonas johnsonii]KCZ94169.1 3-deoxy-D-manno-octulosonic-acid transferase [Hyphomonas johnsonii MHS-2]
MTPGFHAYRTLTGMISPLLPGLLKRRARAGKEDIGRINERLARAMPNRKPGRLVWLHGASVGESRLLLELGHRLLAERPDLMLLFTSQTLTSARLLGPALPDNAIHLMAPMDTPGAARRFIQHWQPDVCVFGEGEIWPNLIYEAGRSGAKRALVNARMTQGSADGWRRVQGLFRKLVGRFDVVLAADTDTAQRLGSLLGRNVRSSGNLKSALPGPEASEFELRRIREGFVGGRRCLVAASTHEGEEALFLDAAAEIPDSAIIIAPRHPERGDAVEALVRERGLHFARRSKGQVPNTRTRVLLADTMGEMGLWLRLADAVYLGGGHAAGVGGHNPLEPVRFGKPVVTGPDVFNFAGMMADLEARGLVKVASDSAGVADALQNSAPPPAKAVAALAEHADAPMVETLAALMPLIPEPGLLR